MFWYIRLLAVVQRLPLPDSDTIRHRDSVRKTSIERLFMPESTPVVGGPARPAFILSSRCRISRCNAPHHILFQVLWLETGNLAHNPTPMWLIRNDFCTTESLVVLSFASPSRLRLCAISTAAHKKKPLGNSIQVHRFMLETPPKY